VTTDFEARDIIDSHDAVGFNCGKPPLNEWLQRSAHRAQRQGTARTVVLTHPGSNRILGYYSLAPTVVDRIELPAKAAGGISTVPAYLLARLAIDTSLQGHGLGADLLALALQDIVAAAAKASGRLVIVDAIDEPAIAFYQRHGFRLIPGSRRLYRPIADIIKAQADVANN